MAPMTVSGPAWWCRGRRGATTGRRSRKPNTGNQLYVNQMESFAKGRGAYAAWYTQAFGIGPDINEVAGAGAAHVLVGPVPDKPLPYRETGWRDAVADALGPCVHRKRGRARGAGGSASMPIC